MSSIALDQKPQTAGGLSGRDAVWFYIRQRNTFTTADLAADTRIHPATIRSYITGLTRAGYLKMIDNGKKGVWLLVNDIGNERPYVDKNGQPTTQHLGREAMWRTMKIIGNFTVIELAISASTANHKVAELEAKYYAQKLHAAGYLRVIKKAVRSGAKTRYAFIKQKNSGPLPPAIQSTKRVFDRNLGAVMWTEIKGSDE